MRDDLKLHELHTRMNAAEAEAAAARAELATAQARIKELEEEAADDDQLREKMATILRDTANALKGKPDARMLHSWHDLADWGQKARDVVMYYLAATAPGATHESQADFIQALNEWRNLYGRDLFETAIAFTELDK
jgi:hypothetical protein